MILDQVVFFFFPSRRFRSFTRAVGSAERTVEAVRGPTFSLHVLIHPFTPIHALMSGATCPSVTDMHAPRPWTSWPRRLLTHRALGPTPATWWRWILRRLSGWSLLWVSGRSERERLFALNLPLEGGWLVAVDAYRVNVTSQPQKFHECNL